MDQPRSLHDLREDLDACNNRLAETIASVQASGARIHALCTRLEEMFDRGDIWWSWKDRRLHYRGE